VKGRTLLKGCALPMLMFRSTYPSPVVEGGEGELLVWVDLPSKTPKKRVSPRNRPKLPGPRNPASIILGEFAADPAAEGKKKTKVQDGEAGKKKETRKGKPGGRGQGIQGGPHPP